MKRRYYVGGVDGAEIKDRDGRSYGRIYSFTADFEVANSGRISGTTGEGVKDVELQPLKEGVVGETKIDDRVAAVWQHYVATFDSRAELNDQRRKIIERALKVASVEECCRAITGLSRSPHHNGQNDQGIKYLDVRYALKGNTRAGESAEERIQRMGQLAVAAASTDAVTQGRIDALKDEIWRLTPDPNYRQLDADEQARRVELVEQLRLAYGVYFDPQPR